MGRDSVVASLGEFIFTLTMIDRRELFTLGIGIVMAFADSNLLEGEFTTYGTQCAGYLLYAAPSSSSTSRCRNGSSVA